MTATTEIIVKTIKVTYENDMFMFIGLKLTSKWFISLNIKGLSTKYILLSTVTAPTIPTPNKSGSQDIVKNPKIGDKH
jgi:hypothetical protein